jgi:CcmD family protein
MPRIKTVIRALVPLALLAATAVVASAQEIPGLGAPSSLAQQSLRPYWHVFIAYAIAIVLVMGWAISIGRRLSDLEKRLGD